MKRGLTPVLAIGAPCLRLLGVRDERRRRRPRRRSPRRPRRRPRRPFPTGAALGGVLGGPIGASLSDADREAAWNAQIAALDSGQRRSWRGAHGVFGFVEPGAETGGGCRAYSQTIYVAGRPNHGQGVGCKQADGALEDVELEFGRARRLGETSPHFAVSERESVTARRGPLRGC